MTSYTEIPMYFGWRSTSGTYPTTKAQWTNEMALMLKSYLRGEPIYVSISDPKRVGSIGILHLENVQNLLGNDMNYYYRNRTPGSFIAEIESNVDPVHFERATPSGSVKWTGRSNKVTAYGSQLTWLKGFAGPTVWQYGAPVKEKVIPKDRLNRDINVGDFIAYILYQFQGHSAAGIYFGKVTKISNEGEVYAKNIKLNSDDFQAEKRIKESKLITIMSDDLMQQLMLAKLSNI